MRHRVRLAAVGTCVVLFAAQSSAVAWADNWGSTPCVGDPVNCVSLGDNDTHTWYPDAPLGNQFPGIGTATRLAMEDYVTFTVLTTKKKLTNIA